MDNYNVNIKKVTLAMWAVAKSGDYSILRINRDLTKKEKKEDVWNEDKDREAWSIVFQEYLNIFGLTKEYVALLELKEQLLYVQLEYIETDDRFLLNEIYRLEAEINDILNRSDNGDIDKSMILLSKWIGHAVSDETNIVKFHKMLEVHKHEAEELERIYKKNKAS